MTDLSKKASYDLLTVYLARKMGAETPLSQANHSLQLTLLSWQNKVQGLAPPPACT